MLQLEEPMGGSLMALTGSRGLTALKVSLWLFDMKVFFFFNDASSFSGFLESS